MNGLAVLLAYHALVATPNEYLVRLKDQTPPYIFVVSGGGGGAPSFPLLAPVGSVTAPSYGFVSSEDGMYEAGTNTGLDFAVNGSNIFNIRSNQVFTQIAGTAATPAFSGPSGSAGMSFPSSTLVLSLGGAAYVTALTNGVNFINDAIVDNTNNAIYENATGKIGWVSTPSGSLNALTAPDTYTVRNGQPGAILLGCSGGLPTFSSGFGTSPSVTAGGCNSKFQVNVGTGATATSGVIAFSGTLTTAPYCWVNDEGANANPTHAVTTTTQVTLSITTAWAASSKLDVLCF